VSSCVFYHSEEAQMLRERKTKLLPSAENKVHSRGSAHGISCGENDFDALLGLLQKIPILVADLFDKTGPPVRYRNVDNRLGQSLFIKY
jgi:hypothetical protein